MFHFSKLPISVQVALFRLNEAYHANPSCDRICQLSNAWLDEQTDNGATMVPALPASFRFRTVADYRPPVAPKTNGQIGAEFQSARAGWSPVETPCLGKQHHSVMED
jgi:hypothetical protein